MKDQHFELDNYRGPLDLLLHLIREHEMEVTEVSLASLCDQYLEAIDKMESLDVNVAGEFLVTAATLMLIKSRTILPTEEVDLEEELDPGDELILQLLEYRKYKTLALELRRRSESRALRATQGLRDMPAPEEPELEDVELWDVVNLYARLVEELGLRRRFDTMRHEKPLKEYMAVVVDCLLQEGKWEFTKLVDLQGGKESLFPVFLSVLELTRTGQVAVSQESTGGTIVVELRQDRDQDRLDALFGNADIDDEGDEDEGAAEPVEAAGAAVAEPGAAEPPAEVDPPSQD